MEIEEAFMAAVAADFPSVPVSYPDVNFTPPGSGFWLEVSVLRNVEANQPLANRPGIAQGVLQITVCGRSGGGILRFRPLLNQIRAAYRKGRAFASGHRISDNPTELSPLVEGDKTMLPVSMSYSA